MTAYKVLNEGLDNRFNYDGVVDYTYDSNNCQGECDDDDYCRCSRYEGLRTEDYSDGTFALWLLKKSKQRKYVVETTDSMFLLYAVSRVVSLANLTAESFEVEATGGYYGEEIGDITLNQSAFEDIVGLVKALVRLTPQERIQCVLKMEYTTLLPELEGVRFVSRVADLARLRVPNPAYMTKAVKEPKDPLIGVEIGIYRDAGAYYEVIDGYHRLASLQSQHPDPTGITVPIITYSS